MFVYVPLYEMLNLTFSCTRTFCVDIWAYDILALIIDNNSGAIEHNSTNASRSPWQHKVGDFKKPNDECDCLFYCYNTYGIIEPIGFHPLFR